MTLALDGTARLALPQGQLPAEGELAISHAFWAFCGCFASMALFGAVDQYVLAPRGVPFLMGSFGTISVLYFCVGLRAPFLRPWNVIAGHVVAAALACVCVQCVQPLFLARALALACTVATMLWTGCVHPPGGALVLILCDSAKFQALGWTYLLYCNCNCNCTPQSGRDAQPRCRCRPCCLPIAPTGLSRDSSSPQTTSGASWPGGKQLQPCECMHASQNMQHATCNSNM